jgi:hypothetical protein
LLGALLLHKKIIKTSFKKLFNNVLNKWRFLSRMALAQEKEKALRAQAERMHALRDAEDRSNLEEDVSLRAADEETFNRRLQEARLQADCNGSGAWSSRCFSFSTPI